MPNKQIYSYIMERKSHIPRDVNSVRVVLEQHA